MTNYVLIILKEPFISLTHSLDVRWNENQTNMQLHQQIENAINSLFNYFVRIYKVPASNDGSKINLKILIREFTVFFF